MLFCSSTASPTTTNGNTVVLSDELALRSIVASVGFIAPSIDSPCSGLVRLPVWSR